MWMESFEVLAGRGRLKEKATYVEALILIPKYLSYFLKLVLSQLFLVYLSSIECISTLLDKHF
jgi:hypothetical protein